MAATLLTTAEIGLLAILTAQIADLNVTTGKIADLGVTTGKIADLGVTNAKIAAGTIGTGKFAVGAIATADIADSAVTAGKLGAGSVVDAALGVGAVTSTKIADGAVATAKIADGAVLAAKLAADSVTSTKILDGNVTASKLAADSVVTAKILDANVTTAKIADANVTTAKIADANVTTAKIADAAVTTPKFSSTADLAMGGFKITGLGTPTLAGDAVTKTYADALASGLTAFKNAVVAASTVNINIATFGLGLIDGVQTVAGDRVLLKDQTTTSQNGIYLAATGAWTRALDNDSTAEMAIGTYVLAGAGGATQAYTGWIVSTAPATLGTNPALWSQFSGMNPTIAGGGLTSTSGILAVGAGTGLSVGADSVGISAGGVSATELASNAVTTVKILDANVTEAKIADLAVTTLKIANSAVDDAKLASNAVTTVKILNANVTAAKLAADSVETAKIADLNVTEGKLAANAVTSAKISALTQARLGGACDVQVVFMATAAQTDFPVAHTDMDGTAAGHQVFKNGILLELGAGNDYTFVDGGAGVDKIVFPAGLALDTKVLIRYRRTSLVG